jgi:hypothetical protein
MRLHSMLKFCRYHTIVSPHQSLLDVTMNLTLTIEKRAIYGMLSWRLERSVILLRTGSITLLPATLSGI